MKVYTYVLTHTHMLLWCRNRFFWPLVDLLSNSPNNRNLLKSPLSELLQILKSWTLSWNLVVILLLLVVAFWALNWLWLWPRGPATKRIFKSPKFSLKVKANPRAIRLTPFLQRIDGNMANVFPSYLTKWTTSRVRKCKLDVYSGNKDVKD